MAVFEEKVIRGTYERSIFINCPFDREYEEMFNAVVFAVFDCGFIARSSREIKKPDPFRSETARLEGIVNLVSQCKFGYHDISRTALDPQYKLPRFDMPFELGLFLGARHFGKQSKNCLIVDRVPNRYEKFLSSIAGQDIRTHNNSPRKAVARISGWLRAVYDGDAMPGGDNIWRRYKRFSRELPKLRQRTKLRLREVTYNDYALIVSKWLRNNPDFLLQGESVMEHARATSKKLSMRTHGRRAKRPQIRTIQRPAVPSDRFSSEEIAAAIQQVYRNRK